MFLILLNNLRNLFLFCIKLLNVDFDKMLLLDKKKKKKKRGGGGGGGGGGNGEFLY